MVRGCRGQPRRILSVLRTWEQQAVVSCVAPLHPMELPTMLHAALTRNIQPENSGKTLNHKIVFTTLSIDLFEIKKNLPGKHIIQSPKNCNIYDISASFKTDLKI